MVMTIGQIIKCERKNKKITQSDLAGNFISVDNLKQIEENKIKASISTLAYIAKKLDLDIECFLTEQSKVEQLTELTKALMEDYKKNQCEKIIHELNELKVQAPIIFRDSFITDIYISTHFKYGEQLTKEGNYEKALKCYNVLLEFEEDFMLDNELLAYELYIKLVDVYTMKSNNEKAQEYKNKAKIFIKKMLAAKEVQNLYLLMSGSEPRDAINEAKKIDVTMLDEYSQAKMNMVLGNAYYTIKHYKTALDYLLLAIKYYEEKTYNSLTIIMYEEVSKCYSNLDEHKLAIEYMVKVKTSQQERHQLS